jgi:hypothetical protein
MDIRRNNGTGLYCSVVELSGTVAFQNVRHCIRKPPCYCTITFTNDNSAKASTHNNIKILGIYSHSCKVLQNKISLRGLRNLNLVPRRWKMLKSYVGGKLPFQINDIL